ncbi:beta-lactamase domain-containing protein 2-like [Lytechinus variegatus]|uniref:beta-lactamase domain-containing protein 2-like n=1 Tax=Lytechinus variegatus TaxID=7654 RepID=UPI001BB2511D|nr:beta-lactamase domain-containing protein 2-like [Lytechinus variegatus]
MSLLRNAILVAVTACLVAYLPGYFKKPPPIVVHGKVAKGFEPVLQQFRKNFESGTDTRYGGSALAVYHKGKKIVDVWGGFADVESNVEWREDTMTVVFSATKGIASICIAMLVDRGLLDYDKPVSEYWPEFAQKGKGKVTVRQLMEHKAGLTLMAPPGMNIDTLSDVARAGELMATAETQWEIDGVKHGYHALTFGPLTNELLRRVDPQHRTMGQFFAEEIAKPLGGLDFHIGLPLDQKYRVARLIEGKIGRLWGLDDPQIRQMTLHFLRTSYFSNIQKNQESILTNMASFNNPYFQAVELPSANGIGTARAVAKIYGVLAAGGVDPETKTKLMSKERIDAFMNASTITTDEVLGLDLAHTLGMVTTKYVVNGSIMGFGHEGAGGQKAWADPENQIGFSFISSAMSPYTHNGDIRSQDLTEILYECLRKEKLI